jgi:hypothetical protein
MKKYYILVAIAAIFLLYGLSAFKSTLRRHDAVKIVRTVLTHWKNSDLTLAMAYWEKESDSPPVYDLIAFEIGKGSVVKKDGTYTAQVSVDLNFPPGNQLPSEGKWTFSLTKTRYGWKITDFVLSDNGRSP